VQKGGENLPAQGDATKQEMLPFERQGYNDIGQRSDQKLRFENNQRLS